MTTPTYPVFDHAHPIISDSKISTVHKARNNLLNLRDCIIHTGYLPGWNMSLWVNTGTELQPDGWRFVKNLEHIWVAITWVSRDPTLNGNGNNYPSKMYFYYTIDGTGSGSQPLTDINGKYVITYTYAADDTCTAATWGTS